MGWALKHYGLKRDLEDIWRVFSKVEDQVFMTAVKRLIGEHLVFPTLVQIGEAVSTAGEELRARRKQEGRLTFEVPKVNSEMGRRVVKLMDRMILPDKHPEKLTSKKLAIIMITELEGDYPGQGWKDKGRQLLDWAEGAEQREEKRKTSFFIERQAKVR